MAGKPHTLRIEYTVDFAPPDTRAVDTFKATAKAAGTPLFEERGEARPEPWMHLVEILERHPTALTRFVAYAGSYTVTDPFRDDVQKALGMDPVSLYAALKPAIEDLSPEDKEYFETLERDDRLVRESELILASLRISVRDVTCVRRSKAI